MFGVVGVGGVCVGEFVDEGEFGGVVEYGVDVEFG